ncbi:hypothetical protein SAMN04488128_101573 [Chitinophaga eiseniae]|uniref:Uncharacterized protein n=1 Tax=Chitinophaga eiseniae TaxID=634771 RepID=A0A1T4LBW4_9BACT|nr:hypothetical protein SAMN04488128_101573 [Chitinophaga eiseniae]
MAVVEILLQTVSKKNSTFVLTIPICHAIIPYRRRPSVVRMGAILMIRELFPHADIAETETFDEAIKKPEKELLDMLLPDIHIPGGRYHPDGAGREAAAGSNGHPHLFQLQ